MPRAKYTEDESILALLLYITIERKDIRRDNPEIVRTSTFLTESGYERTPGSLKAKLENFKAFDPMYGGSGMTHFSKTDRDVWDRFYATGFTDLADAAEGAAERISHGRKNLGDTLGSLSGIGGTTAVREIKVRVDQEIFRSRVLEAYGFRCCITGIQSPGLIEACHIKNWS